MTAAERRNETLAALVMYAGPLGFDQVDPHLMLAQADLESGGFTSELCREANNAWGMMFPRVRPTTATGQTPANEGAFAVYANLAEGARDYLMRQRYFNVPNTSDPVAYMTATVASGYATDPDYLTKWADRANVPTPADVPAPTENASGGASLFVPLMLVALWAGSR